MTFLVVWFDSGVYVGFWGGLEFARLGNCYLRCFMHCCLEVCCVDFRCMIDL